MSHSIELKEGAFILGDAHYSYKRPELLEFIRAIHSKKLKTTQIIFMGDIFDALFGSISKTLEENKEAIRLILEISQDIEIVYLEGNHDFNLKKVFKNIKIFTIYEQALRCTYNNKTIYLAHGDFESNTSYRAYTWFIRNPYILPVLNILNNTFNNFVLKNLDKYLGIKDDCKEFTGFRKYISQRLDGKYECDYFIEGHYHQNKTVVFDHFIYINLAAFACNQRYFIVNSLNDKELLKEKIFSKESQ
jgi:UDP-2,3-diacylglucosamine hydrolase